MHRRHSEMAGYGFISLLCWHCQHMKNRFFHIAPLFFLFFLLLPFMGLLLLQGAQWYCKATAKERMQHHALLTLSLPAADAVWHKKGKELRIDGKLFDVKTLHTANGIITVIGFFDEKETEVFHLLAQLVSPQQSNGLLYFMLVLQCFAMPLFFYAVRAMQDPKIVHCTSVVFYFPQPFCRPAEQPPQR